MINDGTVPTTLDSSVEPPRMLPKKFPSLLVEEQEDRGLVIESKSKDSERSTTSTTKSKL
jgi:hypothetical protein